MFYLFRVHHWGLRDLQGLYEAQDAWPEIVRVFAACDAQLGPLPVLPVKGQPL